MSGHANAMVFYPGNQRTVASPNVSDVLLREIIRFPQLGQIIFLNDLFFLTHDYTCVHILKQLYISKNEQIAIDGCFII